MEIDYSTPPALKSNRTSNHTSDFSNHNEKNITLDLIENKLEKTNEIEISNLIKKFSDSKDKFEMLEICSQINILNKTDTELQIKINTIQGMLYSELENFSNSYAFANDALKD